MVLCRRLAELCDARICLGGKFEKHTGFVPGILEESLVSAGKATGNRVLHSGLLGGAAKQVIAASCSGQWQDLIRLRDQKVANEWRSDFVGAWVVTYRRDAMQFLNEATLSERSGLSKDDWD